jgi:hypothetical protein
VGNMDYVGLMLLETTCLGLKENMQEQCYVF